MSTNNSFNISIAGVNNEEFTGSVVNDALLYTTEDAASMYVGIGSTSNYLKITQGVTNIGNNLVVGDTGAGVGIGTSPEYPLHIAKDTTLTTSQYAGESNQGQFIISGKTNTNQRLALMYDTTSNIGLIQSFILGSEGRPLCLNATAGNVGIGTTSPVYKLDVNGSFNCTSLLVNGQPLAGNPTESDDRIKSDEILISNATQTINKLRPQIYNKWSVINYASNSNATFYKESGLIAQEIFYDAPELRHLVSLPIDCDSNAIYNSNISSSLDPSIDPDYSAWGSNIAFVNYIGLIPYLIRAIQEKDQENQELKASQSNILARLSALENA